MAVIGCWGEGTWDAREALVAAGHAVVDVAGEVEALLDGCDACLVAAETLDAAAAVLGDHRARLAPLYFPVLAVVADEADRALAARVLDTADDTIACGAAASVWERRLACHLAARERSREAHLRELLAGLADGLAQEIDGPLTYLGGNLEFFGQAFSRLLATLDDLTAVAMAPEAGGADDPSDPARLVAVLAGLLADEDLRFALEEVPAAIRESREGLDRLGGLTGAVKRACGPGADDGLPVDVALALEDAAGLAVPAWKPVAGLDVCPDDELPPVTVPAGALRLALVLLLGRVSRAVAEAGGPDRAPGRVELAARLAGDRVAVTVAWAGGAAVAGSVSVDPLLSGLLARHGIGFEQWRPAGEDGPDAMVLLELPCRARGVLSAASY